MDEVEKTLVPAEIEELLRRAVCERCLTFGMTADSASAFLTAWFVRHVWILDVFFGPIG